MTENILEIKQTSGYKLKENAYTEFDGFTVVTDKQEIFLGIDNGQCCCEDWGYFMSQDDFSDFIDADFLGVKVVDTHLSTKKLPDFDCGGVMFVNVETSKGLLQFTAYNSHNGYYGHEAIVRSNSFNHSEGL